MLVIADSSPLHYLILVGLSDLLPTLFGQIIIPPQVRDELTHASTPAQVRELIHSSPPWIVVKIPNEIEAIPEIDEGERAEISLARELHADLLLIDDLDGRRAAEQRGVPIIGMIGVLEAASSRNLIDLRDVIARIRQTQFRVSDALLNEALMRDEARRQARP